MGHKNPEPVTPPSPPQKKKKKKISSGFSDSSPEIKNYSPK